jgi:4-amino-4-deoxy-L-arabinose transferase-like glycosyltransferase
MSISQSKSAKHLWPFVFIFVALKLFFNVLSAGHYGYHRDEMLHLVLGDHLDWGYMEVPPLIALLAKITTIVFGYSAGAARVFPAMASAAMVWFTGLLVIEFGGKRFAIALACLCMIFSPGMAASGYLFQPVVFDQLWWLLAAYLSVKYVNTNGVNYLYWLGLVIGLGLLNKYTMGFFAGALLLGMLLTPQRKLLWRKETLVAVAIAVLVFLPNLLWQYLHHWPVLAHMHNLQHEQLDHVKPAEFIVPQFLMHAACFIVWVTGLGFLLFHKILRNYRFIAFAYLLVFAFLLKMNGKAYYLLAAYPMLFAAGGYSVALFFRNYVVRALAILLLMIPNLLSFPIALPVLTLNQTLSFFKYYKQHAPFMSFTVTWEDHQQHPLSQDYADMLGWEEMAAKTAAAYYSLTLEQRKHTIIFADNYGEAGALHAYRKKYKLPDVVCLNSSFALWAPENLKADYLIYISDDNDVSDLKPVVESYKRMGGIENKLAREYGTGIFLITHPSPVLNKVYQKHRKESRLESPIPPTH